MAKSCKDCPSYLPPNSTFFNKSVGVPTCARFGKVLGRIQSKQGELDQIALHFAKECSGFGEPRPGVVDWSVAKFQVTLPDPDIIGVPPVSQELVQSCRACSNFVREDVVAGELGWTVGLCAAKGKLLFPARFSFEARNCESRSFGTVRESTTNLMLLPEYEDNFVGSADPVRTLLKQQANFVDPTEYETDKPVSAADAERVRAWRAIMDVTTGNTVYLPIFRPDIFTPEQLRKIPKTGDDEHPEDYVDHMDLVYTVAAIWSELDGTPALWGTAGTGKTELLRHMAWLMQAPFERFQLTGSSELDDLVGKMHYTEGVGTHFEKGRIIKAWESICVLDLDEPNLAPPDVVEYLRPMTDDSKEIVLDQSKGEVSERDQDCYVGLAMNPAWDPLNIGANPLGDADQNRLMHLFLELPPEGIEKEILRKACKRDGWEVPQETIDMVMGIAADLRALVDDGSLPISWALRPQIKVIRALRWFDPVRAYKLAVADYLEPGEQRTHVLNVVKTYIGG